MELQQESSPAAPAARRHFIGGEWVGSEGGATFPSLDPFTGEVVAEVAAGTREDAARAVVAPPAAFPAWGQTPPAVRQPLYVGGAVVRGFPVFFDNARRALILWPFSVFAVIFLYDLWGAVFPARPG